MDQAVRRTRREGRAPPSHEDRIRGTLQHAINNPVTKNPTRFVPDLPGFSSLSKAEIKMDTMDIDNKSSLMDMNETDSEDDDVEQTVCRSMAPPCATHSTAHKKKALLTSWLANPALVDVELRKSRAALAAVRQELGRLTKLEDDWIYSLEMSRAKVCSSLLTCKEKVVNLKADSKLLLGLVIAECGTQQKKKRPVSVRDALGELQDRITVFNQKAQEYEKVSLDSKATGKAPITTIHLDELDYSEDAVIFAKKIKHADRSGAPSSSSVRGEDCADRANESKSHDSMVLADDEACFQASVKDDDDSNVEGKSHCTELVSKLQALEEAIRVSEKEMGSLEMFFLEDNEIITSSQSGTTTGKEPPKDGDDAHNVEINKSKQLMPGNEVCAKLAAPFESIRTESSWSKILEDLVAPAGDAARSKRGRGPATVPVSSFVFPRTPRDVPLLISPLSQFEDKFMGALMAGPKNAEVNKNFHPSRPRAGDSLPCSIVCAEDAVLERCRLQSAAAAAQNKIRRLRANALDWKKQMQEGQISLSRSEKNYQQAINDDYQESKRIRKELLDLGIASAGSNELPMSPIAETAGWNTLNVAAASLKIGARNPIGARAVRGKVGVPKGFQARLDGLKAAAAAAASSTAPDGPDGEPEESSSHGNNSTVDIADTSTSNKSSKGTAKSKSR